MLIDFFLMSVRKFYILTIFRFVSTLSSFRGTYYFREHSLKISETSVIAKIIASVGWLVCYVCAVGWLSVNGWQLPFRYVWSVNCQLATSFTRPSTTESSRIKGKSNHSTNKTPSVSCSYNWHYGSILKISWYKRIGSRQLASNLP